MKQSNINISIRRVLQFLCLVLLPFQLVAQGNAVTISGTVVESESKRPIEFATVAVIDRKTGSPVSGTTTTAAGAFSVRTSATDFYIEVSFIGFGKMVIDEFQQTGSAIGLGTISLKVDSRQLDEIVIEGEKSQTEYRLDKRVFNVGADLSSTGANALEVLNNVPSVNVSIEGQISLRGSTGVQVLINGKPSVLASEEGNALGTITADMIESVEVITNPSAKYDAEGTSGIINIMLKKEERKGTNGSVSVNTGVPNNHSIGFSLNRRTEKFNLFTQMGVGYNARPNDVKVVNQNLLTDTTIYAAGNEEKYEQYYNVMLGTDYHINDHNVITVSGSYALELEDQPSDIYYSLLSGVSQEATSAWKRTETTDAVNPEYQFEAQYHRV